VFVANIRQKRLCLKLYMLNCIVSHPPCLMPVLVYVPNLFRFYPGCKILSQFERHYSAFLSSNLCKLFGEWDHVRGNWSDIVLLP
jgi:hypothetical protein